MNSNAILYKPSDRQSKKPEGGSGDEGGGWGVGCDLIVCLNGPLYTSMFINPVPIPFTTL